MLACPSDNEARGGVGMARGAETTGLGGAGWVEAEKADTVAVEKPL
jgi:hypothetical protein